MMLWKRALILIALMSVLVACGRKQAETPVAADEASAGESVTTEADEENTLPDKDEEPGEIEEVEAQDEVRDEPEIIPEETYAIENPDGMTLAERFNTPEGYTRVPYEESSFAEYLRNYPLKPYGSPVLFYDGRQKSDTASHAAVFAQPMVADDLQQCADAIMRMYADYLYASGQKERISFRLTNGDAVSFLSYTSDTSYEGFEKYFRYICAYAGTLSMESEVSPVALPEMRIGDVFLTGGSPGHACMVVDLCEKDGKKAFLLGESFMPAQEFHVIRNPQHMQDPWYYEEELTYPFRTVSYSFPEGSLKRPIYLE